MQCLLGTSTSAIRACTGCNYRAYHAYNSQSQSQFPVQSNLKSLSNAILNSNLSSILISRNPETNKNIRVQNKQIFQKEIKEIHSIL